MAANFARVAVLFNSCAAFTITWFPARAMLSSFAASTRGAATPVGDEAEETEDDKLHWTTLVWSAALWVGTTCGVAACCQRLGLLFDLIGAIFGSFEVFIYPSLFWWTLCADSSRFGCLPAILLMSVGVFSLVTGVAVACAQDAT